MSTELSAKLQDWPAAGRARLFQRRTRATRNLTPPASAAWSFTFNLRARDPNPDTTGFSRVVLHLQPTSARPEPRHHRLQPRGVSISTYDKALASQTPPASAAWSFTFNLRARDPNPDTTGFSRVVFQFQPATRRWLARHHRLQPRGISISAYDRRLMSRDHRPSGVSISTYATVSRC